MKTKQGKKYTLSGKVWLYPGESANWHFFTIPKKESSEVKEIYKGQRKGFGSLPVEVTLGKTTWKTSIFPDSTSGTFILPIKAIVRKKEEVYEGDSCLIKFSVLV